MRVFVFGATGGVGRRVVDRLLSDGHEVGCLVRRAEQSSQLRKRGVDVRIGDIATASSTEIEEAVRGYDRVLFTAGAADADSDELMRAVDGDGPARVAQACKNAGIRQFYLVSAFPEAWRERHMGPTFDAYMHEKKRAEAQLVSVDIDWVVLRPSALHNQSGTGKIDLGLAKIHDTISRDDVANTLIALMNRPEISRVILEVNGGNEPIGAAVARLAND